MVNIDLKKEVFSRSSFEKVIDTKFSTFVKNDSEIPISLEEFFNLYNNLYLSIPIEGEFQSHEYLVKKSSELYNFEKDTSDIEPLLNEISKLRERLLTSNRRIADLELELLRNNITPSVEISGNEIVGCTDPTAVNYDPLATLPCNNCCKYSSVTSGPDTGGSDLIEDTDTTALQPTSLLELEI